MLRRLGKSIVQGSCPGLQIRSVQADVNPKTDGGHLAIFTFKYTVGNKQHDFLACL